MRTTVVMDSTTRDRLMQLKQQWSARNAEEVIVRLLDGPILDATAIWERNQDRVMPIIKKYGVQKVIAFGSRARGDARPDSDLDLAVVLPDTLHGYDWVHCLTAMAKAFDLPADVTTLPEEGTRFRANIDRDGVLLYG